MNVIQEFSTALSLHGKAFSFIRKNGLSWTFLIPVALFLLMLTIGLYSIGELTEYLTMKVLTNYVYDGLVSSLLLILFRILFFIVCPPWDHGSFAGLSRRRRHDTTGPTQSQ